MSHARVEEVSDSDQASDFDEADIDDFVDSDILRSVRPSEAPRPSPPQGLVQPPQGFPSAAQQQQPTSTLPQGADRSQYAGFQCLYPVYFDATRSRSEGRRVAASLAVRNPLAREIATACSRLRLPTLLEPDKTHPKDWSNPGRVKVGLKKAGGGGGGEAEARTKRRLFALVAEHLRANPTGEDSLGLRVRVGGQLTPEMGAAYPRPAVPRGWKMGELLPYTSAAMTGGGVSENLFKDMMKEMQGGGNPMAALMGGQGGNGGGPAGLGGGDEGGGSAGGKKKKDKKRGKA